MNTHSPAASGITYPALNEDCFVEMYSTGRRQPAPSTANTDFGVSFYNIDEVRPGEKYAILLTKIDIAQDLKAELHSQIVRAVG